MCYFRWYCPSFCCRSSLTVGPFYSDCTPAIFNSKRIIRLLRRTYLKRVGNQRTICVCSPLDSTNCVRVEAGPQLNGIKAGLACARSQAGDQLTELSRFPHSSTSRCNSWDQWAAGASMGVRQSSPFRVNADCIRQHDAN